MSLAVVDRVFSSNRLFQFWNFTTKGSTGAMGIELNANYFECPWIMQWSLHNLLDLFIPQCSRSWSLGPLQSWKEIIPFIQTVMLFLWLINMMSFSISDQSASQSKGNYMHSGHNKRWTTSGMLLFDPAPSPANQHCKTLSSCMHFIFAYQPLSGKFSRPQNFTFLLNS